MEALLKYQAVHTAKHAGQYHSRAPTRDAPTMVRARPMMRVRTIVGASLVGAL